MTATIFSFGRGPFGIPLEFGARKLRNPKNKVGLAITRTRAYVIAQLKIEKKKSTVGSFVSTCSPASAAWNRGNTMRNRRQFLKDAAGASAGMFFLGSRGRSSLADAPTRQA